MEVRKVRRVRRGNLEKYKATQKKWREKNKGYAKKWREENREKFCRYAKKWASKNRDCINIYQTKRRRKYPWESHYHSAKNRCTNHNSPKYARYGGRGIKFLLTMPEVKEIWEKCNANLMKNPSIDRVDNDGNYEKDNCQFLEMGEHSTKSNITRYKRRKKCTR